MEGYMFTKTGTGTEEHQKHRGEARSHVLRQNTSHLEPLKLHRRLQQKQDRDPVFRTKGLCVWDEQVVFPVDDTTGFFRNVKNVCFNVTRLCFCVFILCMCIIGEIVCGRTVSPWNSICVVNALFKAINTLSGRTHKKSAACFAWLVCVCLCVAWCGGWGCVSVCVGCGATLWSSPGSRCVEELSGCWRGLPERGETRKLQTFSSELTAPSASN